MKALVSYELDANVASITMNDGKVNVMTLAMLQALNRAIDQARSDNAMIVLRSGLSGIFSAGFDIKLFAAGDLVASQAMVSAGAELALKLLGHPFPVVSVCNGHAFPMGAFLLLASDVRIAAQGDFRIGLNEVAIGIAVPGFALALAQSRLHPAWLVRTALLGEMFAPGDAMLAGFVDRVVEEDEIDRSTDAIVLQLKSIDHQAHHQTKLRLREPTFAAMRAAIDAELTIEAYRARRG